MEITTNLGFRGYPPRFHAKGPAYWVNWADWVGLEVRVSSWDAVWTPAAQLSVLRCCYYWLRPSSSRHQPLTSPVAPSSPVIHQIARPVFLVSLSTLNLTRIHGMGSDFGSRGFDSGTSLRIAGRWHYRCCSFRSPSLSHVAQCRDRVRVLESWVQLMHYCVASRPPCYRH